MIIKEGYITITETYNLQNKWYFKDFQLDKN